MTDYVEKSGSSSAVLTDRRVWVADQRLIAGARSCVQFGEQRVVQRRGFTLRHRAGAVATVAEDDCLGRAALLAGSLDLAVADAAVLAMRRDLRSADPLHAIGAFLHDAAV